MKHLQLIFLVILIISFPLSVQADFLKKVTKTTKNAGNEIVEVVEPTIEKTTNGVVNTSVNVFDWVETTGDSVKSYEKVLAEAWKTGWRHSGSLDYTGPLSPAALSGHFSIMTYNIDGFPQVIGGNSSEDTRSISAILESMSLDIVVFQEDFTKHDELFSSLTTSTYPFRSNHWRGTETTFGDGLATISKFPFNFRDYRKVQWNECAGTLWEKFLGTSSHP
ncbi:MAG: hypothetical protein H0V39_04070, partial [Nitrosomonas sp.]|nr:hypothetical protein [Nitrosomonas sp.]